MLPWFSPTTTSSRTQAIPRWRLTTPLHIAPKFWAQMPCGTWPSFGYVAEDFRALSFGNVSELNPGDDVFAMGYPLGLPGEATVTKGIVSAIRYDESHQSLVIQTDAAINPGNSGGPMLSETGRILGINTFRQEETQSGRPVDNVGFAIAVPTIQEQLHTLKTARPSSTPTPTPTPRPTPTPGFTPTPSVDYDFGPLNGELQHQP